ncbi:MAG: hypothetical protein HOB84_09690 [Candidatus Marinimicrobia bacterium]|jgi:hypothetical protein|nr:hypothetical protein [Candidatus Neomarinimicrobiota bacterium]MBT4715032.1 hypothetical protein [Candidatus Neomarinimicrobiota bacterium]MBT5271348.1 hypothetical protein [Candidatus Neomarinimicrobiota bacterium]MBT7198830.1 hypothetical protein [Candidatus Neomarinimicrobiota bacterium]
MVLQLKNFDRLLLKANNELLKREPTVITYDNISKMGISAITNQMVITKEIGNRANIYAIWSRASDSEIWEVMYIGQRTSASFEERIKQHLFKTPTGTQSKIKKVREQLLKKMISA